jgi:hypothetical protein
MPVFPATVIDFVALAVKSASKSIIEREGLGRKRKPALVVLDELYTVVE